MDDLGFHLDLDFNLTYLKFNISDFNLSEIVHNILNDKSMYHRNMLMFYLMGIFGMAVCVLGIIGNILSVIVLNHKRMNTSTYSYLTALALSDTIFLVFTIFIVSRDSEKPATEITWGKPYYVYAFPYIHPAAVSFQVTSIWLTCAFTVDRYIMICHPFKAERWCSISRARKVIICVFLAGIVFNIVRFFEYEATYIEVSSNKSVPRQLVIQLTELGRSEEFREIVHSWLYLTCVAGIPFLSLLILNIFLIVAVSNSRRKGKMINATEKRRNDTTVMLIGVVIIFLFCQGPALISRMIWAFDYKKAFISSTWYTFNEVSNFLVILNSAINIVPYYFFGKRFRTRFWRLFCRCIFSKDKLRKITRNLSFSVDPAKQHKFDVNCEMNQHGQIQALLTSRFGQTLEVCAIGNTRTEEANSDFDFHKMKDNGDSVYLTNGNCETPTDDCNAYQNKK